jgi:hypothetical protein
LGLLLYNLAELLELGVIAEEIKVAKSSSTTSTSPTPSTTETSCGLEKID